MKRVVLTVVVATTVFTLVPLAYATPVDPSWIPGLYDDGDGDDVVVLATTAVGSLALSPDWIFHPARRPEPAPLLGPMASPRGTACAPRSGRAPPRTEIDAAESSTHDARRA